MRGAVTHIFDGNKALAQKNLKQQLLLQNTLQLLSNLAHLST